MTRYLRNSLYLTPSDPPLTTVMPEDGVVDTLESIRAQLPVPGALMIQEIFEASNDLEEATREAIKRQSVNAQQEAHQAMLYYWTILKWGLVREGGVLMMDKPAPLSREEICVVFDQLAQHPEHRNISIISHTRTGEPVVMANGVIQP